MKEATDSDALPKHAVTRLGSTRFLPKSDVWAVALSPDGKTIATGTMPGALQGEVELWDAESGRKMGAVAKDGNNIVAIAWSPEGKRIAISHDYQVEIWDPENQKSIAQFEKRNDESNELFWGLKWSRDGTRILAFQPSSAHDSRVYVWDAASYRIVADLAIPAELIGIDVSPDGELLALAGMSYLEIHNLKSSEPKVFRVPKRRSVYSVAFSPDGKTLAAAVDVGSNESSVMLFSANGGELQGTLGPFPGTYTEIAYSPDGAMLASGGWRDEVRLWDAKFHTLRFELKAHGCVGRFFSFSSDGKSIATALRRIMLWDVTSGEARQSHESHFRWTNGVAFTDEDRFITIGSNDEALRVWNLRTGQSLSRVDLHEPGLALSPDGKLAATAASDGSISLRDVRTGSRVGELKVETVGQPPEKVRFATFSPSGSQLASFHSDRKMRLWDMDGKNELRSFECDSSDRDLAPRIAFSPNGKVLAWCAMGKDVELWDLERDESLGNVPDSRHMFGRPFALSCDGRTIAVPGLDKSLRKEQLKNGELDKSATLLRLWDYRAREDVWASSCLGLLNCMAFSPDGSTIATAPLSDNEPIRVWTAETGRELMTLHGHSEHVYELYFSPDGTRLVSASGDTTMLVWDIKP